MVRDVCATAGVSTPVVRWRTARRPGSSGVTRRTAGSVSVTAGTDPVDQRLTLLHELAHWLGPAPRRRRGRVQHHDARFYEIAFNLYRTYDIPDADVLVHEGGRYPSALRHAREAGLSGADEAWRARRAARRERASGGGPGRVLVGGHAVRLVRDGRWTRCATCGVRVVGPTLARLRRRSGRHILLSAS
jgi:hypothetical protein